MFTLENGTCRVPSYWVSTLSSGGSYVKAVCCVVDYCHVERLW